ncbi:MAG: 16S rRNA (uracil(1498)-N(3))-methyltransferase [Vulcanococcus sp.]|uniref:16S rRNA (uracil(1498)-N(3))-methyltransferase n=1 Tax=Vulcanococcus sp. TaxID=2856995 RepID=UPI0025CE0F84|nr:16S rRNA (uracil(1498)-N(3))-methyltransferase [Vulcanococcus sp.]MBW0166904.1 16S rRNA (uracil(1498)-N(3))-methyltransferase [Vulcanococcus sp.]
MARERRRVLIRPAGLREMDAQGCLALSPEHSRYLRKVLRYSPGDCFAVVDGAGHLWDAELLDHNQARLLQPLEQPLLHEVPPSPALVLVAAVVKRDFELVVRMAVELGVDRLVPITCERTAVLGQLRPERWQAIAEEAAEQCERLWLPQLDPPSPLGQLLRLEPPAPPSAVVRFWATTRQEGLPGLTQALHNPGEAGQSLQEVWLACGPEGGWSPAEEEQAAAAGWTSVQLGSSILRSSTACVAGAAVLSQWRAAAG